jgi:REP element-mobilizing transposase RayT
MEPIEEGHYYHIYNRGAGKGNLFFYPNDYSLFLKLYFYYLYPCIETYAWCLMRNHFHALIKVKTHGEQIRTYRKLRSADNAKNFHGSLNPKIKPYTVSKQLSHLFNSYTKKLNARVGRTGTLIEGPLKRKRLSDDDHFIHILCYIHRNPIHPNLTDNYTDYLNSSYHSYTSTEPSLLGRQEVFSLFGSLSNFLKAHEEFKMKLDWKEDYYLE